MQNTYVEHLPNNVAGHRHHSCGPREAKSCGKPGSGLWSDLLEPLIKDRREFWDKLPDKQPDMVFVVENPLYVSILRARLKVSFVCMKRYPFQNMQKTNIYGNAGTSKYK